MLHTKNSAGYSQWEKILNQKESLENVDVFLVFTPFFFSVDYILKFKYSLRENKSLNLCYWRRCEASFKLHYFWTYGSFSSWWNSIQRRWGERVKKAQKQDLPFEGDNLICLTGSQSQVVETFETLRFPKYWKK